MQLFAITYTYFSRCVKAITKNTFVSCLELALIMYDTIEEEIAVMLNTLKSTNTIKKVNATQNETEHRVQRY